MWSNLALTGLKLWFDVGINKNLNGPLDLAFVDGHSERSEESGCFIIYPQKLLSFRGPLGRGTRLFHNNSQKNALVTEAH